MICAPQHLDTCVNCLEEDGFEHHPLVDYWKNFDSGVVYCRKCMEKEKGKAIFGSKTKSAKMKRLQELNKDFLVIFQN